MNKKMVGLVTGGGPRARPGDAPHREPVVRFLPRQAPEGPTRTQQAPRVERERGSGGKRGITDDGAQVLPESGGILPEPWVIHIRATTLGTPEGSETKNGILRSRYPL